MQGECCKCAIFDVSALRKALPLGSVLALYHDLVGGLAGFAHHDVTDLGDGIAVKLLLIDSHSHAAVGHNNEGFRQALGLDHAFDRELLLHGVHDAGLFGGGVLLLILVFAVVDGRIQIRQQLAANDNKAYYALEVSGLWVARKDIRETFEWMKETVPALNGEVKFVDFEDPLAKLGKKF